jgi:hypothetical protein
MPGLCSMQHTLCPACCSHFNTARTAFSLLVCYVLDPLHHHSLAEAHAYCRAAALQVPPHAALPTAQLAAS